MARARQSLVKRALRQMDLSFWCLHDHLGPLSVLALPVLVGMVSCAAVIAAVARAWRLDPLWAYLFYGVAAPSLCFWVFTMAPLPCAVFAWRRAEGDEPTAGACIRHCMRRSGRLLYVAGWLMLSYLLWFLFGGLPMLVFWPRTCLAPLVALFEDDRRIFRRGRRLLRQETTLHVLAGLYLCMSVALAALFVAPRVVLVTELFAGAWTRMVEQYLWVFELFSGAVVLCMLSVSWCISLAFLYRDIRQLREGEGLRRRIEQLQQQLAGTPQPAS